MTRDQIVFGECDLLDYETNLSSFSILQALGVLSWSSTLQFDSDNLEK